MSNGLRARRSKRAKKARKAYAKRHRNVANRRKNHIHQKTTELIRKHGIMVAEDLSIKNMTALRQGDVEKPAKNVKQKAVSTVRSWMLHRGSSLSIKRKKLI